MTVEERETGWEEELEFAEEGKKDKRNKSREEKKFRED